MSNQSPAWRPASEFPPAGVPVLVTMVDAYWGDGVPFVALAERPHNGPWELWDVLFVFQPSRTVIRSARPKSNMPTNSAEILGWMPTPPPMEISTGLSTKWDSADEEDPYDLT